MRTLSLIVVALPLALGSFVAPVLGAEDHLMMTLNDLKWADIASLPPRGKGCRD